MPRALFSFLVFFAFAAELSAHEVRPAYLQLRQIGTTTYDVFWKVPAVGDSMRLSLYVELPPICSALDQPRGSFSGGAYSEQWSINCQGGLSGSTIRINGLTATLTDVLVRLERLDGFTQVTRLTSSVPSFVVETSRVASRSPGRISSSASSTF
jgi:hypothetical protein